MATRIRRAGVVVGLALLLMATALAGVAWAANAIHCPNVPGEPRGCRDTAADDKVYGTPKKDEIATFDGDDTVYAYKGDDFIEGDKGDDTYYGGRGDDYLAADCDVDSYCGEDEKHGGPGADHIVGNLRSEKHFGGRGNDSLVDADSGRYPDVFRCGPGRDEILYNKGFDKVADDCEILKPYPKRWWTP
jgi:Ca2+-binding RTX toxin-like protein